MVGRFAGTILIPVCFAEYVDLQLNELEIINGI